MSRWTKISCPKIHVQRYVALMLLVATGCVADEITVLAMGDSITFGYGSTDMGGYRSPLFAHAIRDDHPLLFVGPRQDGPNTVAGHSFPRNHDGSSGYTLLGDENGERGIAPRVEEQLSWFRPDILLLMAGTNDILQDIDLENAPERLARLLDEVTAVEPGQQIFVATIPPVLRQDEQVEQVTDYNDGVEQVVEVLKVEGVNIELVPIYTDFLETQDCPDLLGDQVHPNDDGYTLIAETFYQEMKGFLP